jgi:hypothetical protein
VRHFVTYLGYAEDFPMSYALSYFFALIAGMIIIGMSDYLGGGQYCRRIRELEERRSHLRQRMYEAPRFILVDVVGAGARFERP